jgi:hypothetical protein
MVSQQEQQEKQKLEQKEADGSINDSERQRLNELRNK